MCEHGPCQRSPYRHSGDIPREVPVRDSATTAVTGAKCGNFVDYDAKVHRLSRWFMAGLVVLPPAWLVAALTADVRNGVAPAVQAIVAVVGLVAVHRLLRAAEDRGWIYYWKRRGSYGDLGVTSEWLNLYDPSRKHVQQATRRGEWQRDEDDDGDRPDSGDDDADDGGRDVRR
jgi:hypothetical protein